MLVNEVVLVFVNDFHDVWTNVCRCDGENVGGGTRERGRVHAGEHAHAHGGECVRQRESVYVEMRALYLQ